MSVSTLQPIPVNQTMILTERSTDHNITYRNNSDNGQTLHSTDLSLWTDIEAYIYSYWCIVLLITATGLIGNILVFIMMGDDKMRSLSYAVYLKFLAIFDSSLLITRLTLETEKIYFLGRITELKLSLCILSISLRILSPWLVAGLAADRYVCVCFPLSRGRLCTRKKAIVICSSFLGVSLVLTLPFPFYTDLIRGECFPTEDITNYFIFIRLLSSILPCLVILVLNICIIIRIQRSRKFRNSFKTPTTNLSNRQQDSSMRPLVLVSALAFVTLIPVSLLKAAIVSLRMLTIDANIMALTGNICSICFLIYLLNFAQNFYILILSSSNYRHIIIKRLRCSTLTRIQGNRLNQANLNNITTNMSGSQSTGLSLVSI